MDTGKPALGLYVPSGMSLRAGSADGGSKLGVNPTFEFVSGLCTVLVTIVPSPELAFVVTLVTSVDDPMHDEEGVDVDTAGVFLPTVAGDDLGDEALWLLLHLPLLDPGVVLLLLFKDTGVRTLLPADPPLSSGEPVLSLVQDS